MSVQNYDEDVDQMTSIVINHVLVVMGLDNTKDIETRAELYRMVGKDLITLAGQIEAERDLDGRN